MNKRQMKKALRALFGEGKNLSRYRGTYEVNCNDSFYWACGDCETVRPRDVRELRRARRDVFAVTGGTEQFDLLWVCRKRRMRPQGAVYSYIPGALWALFDAAGPERPVGMGNPYAPGGYRRRDINGRAT